MRTTNHAALALALAAMTGIMFQAGNAAAKSGPYRPVIDPAQFQVTVDHPYFPLVPGTVYRYRETKGKHVGENEVTVTHDTKVIMGVTCTVVHDRVLEKGVVKEDTFDWYAQDKQGNVWYFGEDTREFHAKGKISREGSWEAGVGKDQPGIFLPASPAPGEPYRQEYSPGNAEDMGQVMAVSDNVTVPFGTYAGCVRTKEWSLLEAGSAKKWYARGVGFVRAESAGEVEELIEVNRP